METRERIKEILDKYKSDIDLSDYHGGNYDPFYYIINSEQLTDELATLITEREMKIQLIYNKKLTDLKNELNKPIWHSIEEINEYINTQLEVGLPKNAFDIDKVTRVEVIDSQGRKYVNSNKDNHLELSLQDNKRTLKIFINKRKIKL